MPLGGEVDGMGVFELSFDGIPLNVTLEIPLGNDEKITLGSDERIPDWNDTGATAVFSFQYNGTCEGMALEEELDLS